MSFADDSRRGRDGQEGLLPKRVSFADDSGSGRVNLIEVQDEFWEKKIDHFKQFLRNELDVMAAKRRQEKSQRESVKRMKEMSREKDQKSLDVEDSIFKIFPSQKIMVHVQS